MTDLPKHLPPQNIPASTLWAKLQEMPRPHKVVDFPRNTPDGKPAGQIAIFVLTQEEQMICAAAAEKFAKEKLKDGRKEEIGYETIYANEAVVQTLFRACKDSENVNASAFPTPEWMRKNLTSDECSILFERYVTTQFELGPIVSRLSEEELNAWVDRLAEGGLAASPFILLSPETQRVLAHFMASQIVESRKAKSSAGSPDESTLKAEEARAAEQEYELG